MVSAAKSRLRFRSLQTTALKRAFPALLAISFLFPVPLVFAQQSADETPEANPARPTVATPATLTPVGYLQFENGGLYASGSGEFATQSSVNQVTKLTVNPRLQTFCAEHVHGWNRQLRCRRCLRGCSRRSLSGRRKAPDHLGKLHPAALRRHCAGYRHRHRKEQRHSARQHGSGRLPLRHQRVRIRADGRRPAPRPVRTDGFYLSSHRRASDHRIGTVALLPAAASRQRGRQPVGSLL